VDVFEEELRPGGGYDAVFPIPIWDIDGFARRIVVRYVKQFLRISVVLEEVRTGAHGRLMRYDDAHGRFHRHAPGWPEPGEAIVIWFDWVPFVNRTSFAIGDIRQNYQIWEKRFSERTADRHDLRENAAECADATDSLRRG
jgi:hypothetical protein